MEMGQRSEAGECGCEARTSRAELVGLVQLVRCLRAASGRGGEMLAGRRGGEICFGLAERKASLPFCLHFFFFFFLYPSASFSRSCHFT